MVHSSQARMPVGTLPRLGVDLPLATFEQRILADPEVLGMLYTGSLGRGEADRYSDLDITLWLRDAALAHPGRIAHYLGWLGAIHFVYVTQHASGVASNAYVGADWQQVELDLWGTVEGTPHPYFHRASVVKDTDGRLVALVAASGPPTATPTRDAARTVTEGAIYHLGFVTMHNLRGSHHHAVSNLCELADSVYALLCQLRGREGYAERFVERFLRADELALLQAAWPASHEREAIRRAARGLWAWTHYVWRQAEQVLSEDLGIALDTAVFLAAIERLYDWDVPAPPVD